MSDRTPKDGKPLLPPSGASYWCARMKTRYAMNCQGTRLALFCRMAHEQRVRRLQSDLHADDLEPPAASGSWSTAKLRLWFENGGALCEKWHGWLHDENIIDLETLLVQHGIDCLELARPLDKLQVGSFGLKVGPRSRILNALERLQKQPAAEPEAADGLVELPMQLLFPYTADREDGDVDLMHVVCPAPPPLPNGSHLDVQTAATSIGHKLWPGAIELCSHLRTRRESLGPLRGEGRTIEIGCGTATVGLYAAALGAHVTLTDTSRFATQTHLFELIRRNIEANRGLISASGGSARELELDWGDEKQRVQAAAAQSAGEERGFDLLLGSDLLYHEDAFAPLLETIRALLKPDGRGRAVIAHHVRGGCELVRGVCRHLHHFVSLVKASGDLVLRSDGPLAPRWGGETVVFELTSKRRERSTGTRIGSS